MLAVQRIYVVGMPDSSQNVARMQPPYECVKNSKLYISPIIWPTKHISRVIQDTVVFYKKIIAENVIVYEQTKIIADLNI